MWNKIFRRDHYGFGILLGILLPVVFYILLFILDLLVMAIFNTHMLAKQEYLVILSLAINLFAIKYYFVNLNYDKSGRGVLLVTFAGALAYFLFIQQVF